MTNKAHAEGGTKEKLLAAASRVFSEKGFLAATVREICQLAGANIAAVNYHFGDKKHLYEAVLKNMLEDCGCANAKSIDPNLPVEERITVFIHEVTRDIYGDPDPDEDRGQLSAIFHMELAHPSETWPQLIEEHLAVDSLLLRGMIAEMLGPDADPELVRQSCISIYGMMTHHALCWPIVSVIHKDHPDPCAFRERLAEHVSRFALAALRSIAEDLRASRASKDRT
ncbi:TetR/AcrR family transcriptional regulator [Paucidesulfovibrio longus]|uniref:TetR/AcrR family transcriptional regulator n=1 Tax=Paucidesulfovibrio longus TaxID=889 RepID=UPI0003B66509|nr:CerR family C-terminal domain-containing protein [Paucidesulfovibrio longus]